VVGEGSENKEDKNVEEILITLMHLFSARWWQGQREQGGQDCGGEIFD
jgi:hypothetical protein